MAQYRSARSHDARRLLQIGGLALLLVVAIAVWSFALNRPAVGSTVAPPSVPVAEPSSPTDKPFITPPKGSDALFVGDSYTAGTGASKPSHAWPQLVAKHLGWDATYAGAGGTGFTWGGGEIGTDGKSIIDRIAVLAKDSNLNPAVIVLQGGQNDWRAEASEVSQAVVDAVTAAEAAWPDASVIVFGPTAPQPLGASIERIDQSVERGAIVVDALSINPAKSQWFTVKNSPGFDFDGAHVNDGGHQLIADRFIEALRRFEDGRRRV